MFGFVWFGFSALSLAQLCSALLCALLCSGSAWALLPRSIVVACVVFVVGLTSKRPLPRSVFVAVAVAITVTVSLSLLLADSHSILAASAAAAVAASVRAYASPSVVVSVFLS